MNKRETKRSKIYLIIKKFQYDERCLSKFPMNYGERKAYRHPSTPQRNITNSFITEHGCNLYVSQNTWFISISVNLNWHITAWKLSTEPKLSKILPNRNHSKPYYNRLVQIWLQHNHIKINFKAQKKWESY